MFSTVLVANRGEIAVRVIRTLQAMGIRSVAVYSDGDAGAPHVDAADVAIRLGPTPAAESYLAIDKLIAAAKSAGAEAIHPGYGFLSENTDFAAACADAGIVFVGPPASAIEAMGDKIRAKQTVAKAGVPVVPGSDGSGLTDAELMAAAEQIGFPVLLKPSAGGGGKGMYEVHAADQLPEAITSARRQALGAFGDDTLLLERLIRSPRHIEIQVLADTHGNVVHLGERECSLQRRHQKIVEEAPSPLLNEQQRASMGAAACDAARACGYAGAGTVEFIVDGKNPDDWFFMEMNTRLQVEHPVTEQVYGVDLVAAQLRVAAGHIAPWPDRLEPVGHAIEVRVYAEDPAAGFLPTGGRILTLREPGDLPGIRVDSGIAEGGAVGSDYDPMLSKIIAYGADRAEALRRLDAALGRTVLLGLGTNIAFLRALLADAEVRAGALDTGLVERKLAALTTATMPPDVMSAAMGITLLDAEPTDEIVDPFDLPGGWRVGEAAWFTNRVEVPGSDPVEVRWRGRAAAAEIALDAAEAVATSTVAVRRDPYGGEYRHTRDGRTQHYWAAREPGTLWIGRDGEAWAVHQHAALEALEDEAGGASGPVRSPMPGTVTIVDVAEGEAVTAGQRLVVVEAMKMEHALLAPTDGVVRDLRARVGATVAKDAALAVVEPADQSS